MKAFIKKYSHAWTLLYVLLYFPWFVWLEQRKADYTLIHTGIDNYIPFCEYFAIPYFLWFLYVPMVTVFILFKCEKKDFYKYSAMLFIGMSVCLLICTIFPNGQSLRVNIDFDRNIFTMAIKSLYQVDTSTNVFPSIHVYNSLVCHICLCKAKQVKDNFLIKTSSFILMLSICLSTMFLKQHSIIDVFGAIILCVVMYILVYQLDLIKSNKLLEKPVSR